MRRKCGKPSSPLRILFFGAQFADVFLEMETGDMKVGVALWFPFAVSGFLVIQIVLIANLRQ